jgi:molybdopterin synthase catalytic subunit
MSFQLSSTPLKDSDLRRGFVSPQAGAFNCFEGRVRDHSGKEIVVALEYQAYESLCRKEAQKIMDEAKAHSGVIDIKIAHRTGRLTVGETAVWIGVLAVHREEGFTACRYVIDELKKRLPVWKKEYYADGYSGWSHCPCPAKESEICPENPH